MHNARLYYPRFYISGIKVTAEMISRDIGVRPFSLFYNHHITPFIHLTPSLAHICHYLIVPANPGYGRIMTNKRELERYRDGQEWNK